MAAPSTSYKSDGKQKRDQLGPVTPGPATSRKKSGTNIYSAMFVGLFETSSSDKSFALFVNSLSNRDRLPSASCELFYQAFAIEIPADYSSGAHKFTVGIPYLFKSSLSRFDSDHTISLISCPLVEISPLLPKDHHLVKFAPIIRGTFEEIRGKYCVLHLTELPAVRFFSRPEILVFLDQVSDRPGFLLGNDVLLEPRTGISKTNGKPFVCVSTFKTTVHRGSFTLDAIQDTPPANFVASLAEKINAHLLIGCEDVPGRLTINNREIIAMGGLKNINSLAKVNRARKSATAWA
jgi:hypothetical protein